MATRFLRHPWLKLMSLVMASLLWLTVTRDQAVERSLAVPLEYQNIPEGLEIVGDPPGNVDVRLRGPSGALGRLEAGEVVAVLDLKLARPGQRLFHLLTDQVRVPWGIQVSQVSPPTVSLEFERSGRKLVPVVPSVEGEPAAGHVAGKVTTSPATVEVLGPESRLDRVTEATTEPVSIQDARTTVRDVVTVGVVDSALRLSEARTATVTVEIVRTMRDVHVTGRNLPPGMSARFTPATVDVIVRGSREAVAALGTVDVQALVDLSNLQPGRYVLPVKGESGPASGVVRTEPASVQVRIR